MWSKVQSRFVLHSFALAIFGAAFLAFVVQANEQVLKSFGGALFREGQHPQASLVQGLDGALYSTSIAGGSNNAGTIFRINPDGTGFVILHEFGASNRDGLQPSSA